MAALSLTRSSSKPHKKGGETLLNATLAGFSQCSCAVSTPGTEILISWKKDLPPASAEERKFAFSSEREGFTGNCKFGGKGGRKIHSSLVGRGHSYDV